MGRRNPESQAIKRGKFVHSLGELSSFGLRNSSCFDPYSDIARVMIRPRINKLTKASVPAIIFAIWV